MTRVAIVSASAAVTRTMEAILAAAGLVRTPVGQADVVLRDMLHPLPYEESTARVIALVADKAAAEHLPDSLVCPVRPAALLRRLSADTGAKPLPIGGGWALDRLARSVVHTDATAVPLTEKECLLLGALLASYPGAIGREALLTDVWGITRDIDTHTLETHIYRLRSKLDGLRPPAGDILTEGGAYKFTMERPA